MKIENDGFCLYAISAEWISQWRDFINRKGEQPGPINNKVIAEKIHNKRKQHGYRLNDNKVQMKDEQDIFSLSHKFWGHFANTYGYDISIQIRKYES